MSLPSSSSSPPSPDPGTYISILQNIKRKALNAGTKSRDFDIYLRRVLHTVHGPKYDQYTKEEKTWHIDFFMWENYFPHTPFPFFNEIDFYPAQPSNSRPVIRYSSIPQPIDVTTPSSTRVGTRHSSSPNIAVYSNQFQAWPPWQRNGGNGYVPNVLMGYPPPLMGSLTSGGADGDREVNCGAMNDTAPPHTPTRRRNDTQRATPPTTICGQYSRHY